MEKFKQFVEKWVDTENIHTWSGVDTTIDVFVNPSKKDLSECGPECRGVIGPKGDLYIAKNGPGIIHTDLIWYLQRNGALKGGPEEMFYGQPTRVKKLEGLTVQQVKGSTLFALGESVELDEPGYPEEKVEALLELARKKNPGIEFTSQSIIGNR